jgi:2-oxo-4-hydroxy-4-carboxy--5-ureidoimidazoline (OHCU) decarboxylase
MDINSQEYDTFVKNFSNIVQDSPLIAGTLWSLKPFKSVDHFVLETRKTMYSMPKSSTLMRLISLNKPHCLGQKKIAREIGFRGPFTNYVDKILAFLTN